VYKRTQIEILLTREEQKLALDYFRFRKTFRRTAELISFLLWRRGVTRKIDYRTVSRWLRRTIPLECELLLREREEERRKWREQRKKQREEYDLKDLIIIGRKR